MNNLAPQQGPSNKCECSNRSGVNGYSLCCTIIGAVDEWNAGNNKWVETAKSAARHIQSGTLGSGGNLDWYIQNYSDTVTDPADQAVRSEILRHLQENGLHTCIWCEKPIVPDNEE